MHKRSLFSPEFKGYYGEVTWMELSTVEGKLYIASPGTGLFVRLFDFYALSDAAKPHPEIPVGNISFLDSPDRDQAGNGTYHQYKSIWSAK